MEKRDSFVFYRSFYEAVTRLKQRDQAAVMLAICDYALNGVQRDLGDIPGAIFMLIKPNLDANQRKFENGKKGGRKKTREEPSENQGEAREEPALPPMGEGYCETKDSYGVREEGEEQPALAAVIAAFEHRINPNLSQSGRAELKGFAETMGPDCCLRSFEIAQDAGKASWPYVRAILRAKQEQGVRSLADWDRLEQQRESASSGGENLERLQRECQWLDGFVAETGGKMG